MHIGTRHCESLGKTALRVIAALFVLLFWLPVSHAAASMAPSLSALTFRMAGDAQRTRVIVNFDQEPQISLLLLANPYRLVLDMPEARFGFDDSSLAARGLVTSVRYGLAGKGRSRIILTMKGPFKVENLNVYRLDETRGYRLMADIVASTEEEFRTAMTGNRTGSSFGLSRQTSPLASRLFGDEKPFTVMIDPGHGGIDSGAESVGNLKEKDLTLAFARELRDRLAQEKGMRVLMTRDDDIFLRLSERVRLARESGADLFISIHADKINQSDIRGATVYTISDKASDAVAHAMAERENKSDTLGGAVPEEQPEVADILLDLMRRETHSFSLIFAEDVVANLRGKIALINNPHRFAGFQVLRAPDVPSVLIELGYLSNKEDEKLLTDPEWRKLFADRIALAVKNFETGKRVTTLSKQ